MSGRQIVELVETPFGPWLSLCHDHNAQYRREGQLGHDKEIEWLRECLSKISQPVFLDIGAHSGLFCLRLHDLCYRIHAWEPQRIVFNLLAGTVALNSWTDVWVHCNAVGNRFEETPVPTYDYSRAANFGGIGLVGLPPEKYNVGQLSSEWDGEMTTVRTLDSYGFKKVDAIKIDVEGMELEVLEGGLKTIRNCRPRILVEHVVTGIDLLKDWLQKENYICIDFGGDLACERR